MTQYNIYTGRKGKLLHYEITEEFSNALEADLYAQEIAETDAREFGYPISDCYWLAVETESDNIPYDQRVGLMYI